MAGVATRGLGHGKGGVKEGGGGTEERNKDGKKKEGRQRVTHVQTERARDKQAEKERERVGRGGGGYMLQWKIIRTIIYEKTGVGGGGEGGGEREERISLARAMRLSENETSTPL